MKQKGLVRYSGVNWILYPEELPHSFIRNQNNNRGYEKAISRTAFLTLQLEMYRLSLNYLTTGMTDTIFSFTIISLQRHWTKSKTGRCDCIYHIIGNHG